MIEQYRATGGVVTMLYPDSTLVLVTMRGARTGREITLPLEFFEWTGCCICSPPTRVRPQPGWYYNLLANPDVTVEHGTRRSSAALASSRRTSATAVAPLVELKPRFAEYEQKTDRTIPVFALDRV